MKRCALWIAMGLVISGSFISDLLVPSWGAERIKIAVPGLSTAFAPLYHAQQSGYFAEEGLDVEVVAIVGAGSLQAVLSRDAQFTVAPGTYQLMVYEKGQRLVGVMSMLTRNAINIVMHRDAARQKGITERSPLADKIRALKGLKVSGVTPGGISHQVLVYYLLKAGLDPQKDVQLVGLGNIQGLLAALEQRQIDAFATGTPTPEAAAARGFGLMVVDNSAGEDPDFAEFMMDVLMATPETVKQQPALVRKVVRALLKSNAWILDHPAEQAVPVMKPVLSRLDDAVILAGLQKTRLGIPRDGRVTERAVTLTQEFLRRIGALKMSIPYDQIVTNEFLPR
ncbi:MAG TPA: ABC transporter substrate-binding protein [Candidatus Acidoferrum sp.]|nr:ABC transporter substrate-binding protein [Candidatus Acidoferrum sp.]